MAIRAPCFLDRVIRFSNRVPYFYRRKSYLDDRLSCMFNKKASISSPILSTDQDHYDTNFSYDDLDIPDYCNNMINDKFSLKIENKTEENNDWSTTEDHEVTSEGDHKVNSNDIFYRFGTYASDDDTTISI